MEATLCLNDMISSTPQKMKISYFPAIAIQSPSKTIGFYTILPSILAQMMQCRLLLTRASIAPLLQTTWQLSLHYFISETNENPLAILAFLNQKAIQRHKMSQRRGSRVPCLGLYKYCTQCNHNLPGGLVQIGRAHV